MRLPLSRLTVWLTVLVTLVVASSRASAQCAITGPTQVCGSPVTLCAPDGSGIYQWTLPDGSLEYTQCILATTPGTYALGYMDPATGWTVCTREMTSGGAAPAITGATSACEGTTISLCGPSGDFDYEWFGPNGVSAATMCVNAGVAGNWLLRVRPIGTACWTEWAVQEVAFTACEPSPSPSPSPSPTPFPSPSPSPSPSPEPRNCPRPVSWWSQQCPDHDRSRVRLDASAMSAIASCVASHDPDLTGDFCSVMNNSRSLRMRASRQVAALWANVCASGMNLTAPDGRLVGLELTTTVDLHEFQGTVGAWLAQANATLGAMGASRGRGAKKVEDESCRRLIRVAWQLNHGIGIGPVCRPDHPRGASDDHMVGELREASAMAADPEPLEAELRDDAGGALEFGVVQPNPVRSHMTMAYAITTVEAQDITIGVYDINGRLVRELVHGTRTPGEYVATWDGLDRNGVAVRGGLYFVLGRIGGERVQSRVTLVR